MLAIMDYEAGNLTSVKLAVEHVAGPGKAVVTQDPAEVAGCERVIFPGVGAAGSAMANLARLGLDKAVKQAVAAGKPVLGICVGQQVAFDHSDEDGGVSCLGLLPGRVVRFSFPSEQHVKIPHMGWNEVRPTQRGRAHPVLSALPEGAECYFVHSYYPAPARDDLILATTEYAGLEFACVVGEGNLLATQFHPEKSGRPGLDLLAAFLEWDGTMPA